MKSFSTTGKIAPFFDKLGLQLRSVGNANTLGLKEVSYVAITRRQSIIIIYDTKKKNH